MAVSLGLWAAPADDLKALADQGKAAEAYQLGKKFPDQLGNPAFDFYFGIAAIDPGHAGEGVLALEHQPAGDRHLHPHRRPQHLVGAGVHLRRQARGLLTRT